MQLVSCITSTSVHSNVLLAPCVSPNCCNRGRRDPKIVPFPFFSPSHVRFVSIVFSLALPSFFFQREIQRTLMELLNQLDGFEDLGQVKMVMATNRPGAYECVFKQR